MLTDQMRGLADLADKFGSGTIRMTVWQNLLISDVKAEDIPSFSGAWKTWGFHWRASGARGGLVACTGNAGCKFAASNTKKHALAVADHLDACLELGQPINIHLTGCPNSCAQHYLRRHRDDGHRRVGREDMVEGYHVYIGGGYGEDQQIGREIHRSVVARTSLRRRADAPGLPRASRVGRRAVQRLRAPTPHRRLKAWFESSPLTPA